MICIKTLKKHTKNAESYFSFPQVRARILLLPLSWKNRNFKEGTSFKLVQVMCVYITHAVYHEAFQIVWMNGGWNICRWKKSEGGQTCGLGPSYGRSRALFSWLLYIMISRGTRWQPVASPLPENGTSLIQKNLSRITNQQVYSSTSFESTCRLLEYFPLVVTLYSFWKQNVVPFTLLKLYNNWT